MSSRPRIAPGTPAQIGRVNWGIARLLGAATGGPPPNVFTTLARHRGLFRRWLRFAGALMPGGRLPRADSELLILRVAHNCDSEYEWDQHEGLARAAGLSPEEIERVREGPDERGWSERQALLLRACDELHANRTLDDQRFRALREHLSEVDVLELCMLVGHYEMLAMTLNTAGTEPDAPAPGQAPRIVVAVQRRLANRARTN